MGGVFGHQFSLPDQLAGSEIHSTSFSWWSIGAFWRCAGLSLGASKKMGWMWSFTMIHLYIYICLLFTVSIISDGSKYQHHQVYVAWRFEALWILCDWTAWEAPVQHKWCSLAKGCFTVLRGIRWMSIMKVCCFAAILRSPDTGWCSIVLIVLVAYTHFGRSCKMLKTCKQRFSNERRQYMWSLTLCGTCWTLLHSRSSKSTKLRHAFGRSAEQAWGSSSRCRRRWHKSFAYRCADGWPDHCSNSKECEKATRGIHKNRFWKMWHKLS